jgi:hypothetical protein
MCKSESHVEGAFKRAEAGPLGEQKDTEVLVCICKLTHTTGTHMQVLLETRQDISTFHLNSYPCL